MSAEESGWEARKAGNSLKSNPYNPNTQPAEYRQWQEGWAEVRHLQWLACLDD